MKEVEIRILISAVVLLVSFIAVSGCFITNCPPGGKRSGGNGQMRQCESCGPPGMNGRCYGPRICCSPLFGCLMGTVDTIPCLQENHHPTLCQNPGESCTGNDESISFNGNCAANGICCSTDICTLDNNCRNNGREDPLKPQQLLKPANHFLDDYHIPHHFNRGPAEAPFEIDNNLPPQFLFPGPISAPWIPRKDRGTYHPRHIFGIGNKVLSPNKPNRQMEMISGDLTDKISPSEAAAGGELNDAPEVF